MTVQFPKGVVLAILQCYDVFGVTIDNVVNLYSRCLIIAVSCQQLLLKTLI